MPFHSWLPDAHAQAPTAGSVDLAGVLLKTAGYGLLRFGVPLFPNASIEFAPIAMWLGVFGIFYGAILACAQTDIKRLIAYTSVSHMGFVLVGIYSGNMVALQGVVVQMLAHGISAGALFILCGELYERLHTRDLREMGGLWSRMRFLPPIMLFFAAASLGLPGMGNFVGEIMILLGSFKVNAMVATITAGGLILAAIYGLLMMQKAFYGPAKSEHALADLNGREKLIMISLIITLLWLGLYPQAVFDTSVVSMQNLHFLFSQASLPALQWRSNHQPNQAPGEKTVPIFQRLAAAYKEKPEVLAGQVFEELGRHNPAAALAAVVPGLVSAGTEGPVYWGRNAFKVWVEKDVRAALAFDSPVS